MVSFIAFAKAQQDWTVNSAGERSPRLARNTSRRCLQARALEPYVGQGERPLARLAPKRSSSPVWSRSRSSAFLPLFGGRVPLLKCKIDYREKGTLILTSPLEDLVVEGLKTLSPSVRVQPPCCHFRRPAGG